MRQDVIDFMDLGVIGDISESMSQSDREWLVWAMNRIDADLNRSSDTHLQKLELPGLAQIDIYLKDESIHPTGSLKHRLARSLILYGICNGKIRKGTTLVEASSGSTAVSEAYFAKLLNLPFLAVVPRGTSSEKLKEIARYGGRAMEVPSAEIYQEAEKIARNCDGYYLDQFTNAERATDWRSNNNIAESLFDQMALERFPEPEWVVCGAGTGGTSATIGRYIRYKSSQFHQTKICVADPENSVLFDGYRTRDYAVSQKVQSRIEGVGRPRMEPSFLIDVVDRMLKIEDAASCATMLWLMDVTGRTFGPSTGLNVFASLYLASEMQRTEKQGSIVTLICDRGDRYSDTCFNKVWREQNDVNVEAYLPLLQTYAKPIT